MKKTISAFSKMDEFYNRKEKKKIEKLGHLAMSEFVK